MTEQIQSLLQHLRNRHEQGENCYLSNEEIGVLLNWFDNDEEEPCHLDVSLTGISNQSTNDKYAGSCVFVDEVQEIPHEWWDAAEQLRLSNACPLILAELPRDVGVEDYTAYVGMPREAMLDIGKTISQGHFYTPEEITKIAEDYRKQICKPHQEIRVGGRHFTNVTGEWKDVMEEETEKFSWSSERQKKQQEEYQEQRMRRILTQSV